ncbi:MAG: hypothetical protein RIR18_1092 [Pseudomonadota bacterium]
MSSVTEQNLPVEYPTPESAFNRLIAKIPAMMHSIDALGCLVAVSQKWLDTLGYRREEVIGKKSSDFLTQESRQFAIDNVLPEFFRTGRCSDIPYQFVAKDGRLIDVLLSANGDRNEQGEIIRSLCVMQDVTDLRITQRQLNAEVAEQRVLERRLRLSESALKEAQCVAHIGSWVLDHQTNELIWSDEIFEILGHPRQTTPSKEAFLARLHPDDYEDVKKAYKRSLTYNRPYEIRHRLLMPDGSIKYVHQRSESMSDENGQRTRSLGTMQDVTLSVLQEMAYLESEERFRTIADHTYDWEYWVGNSGEILYISPSCLRVTGYSQAEFISDPKLAHRIIHPDDQVLFDQHLQDIQQSERSQINFRIVRKDGSLCWIAHGCKSVTASDGSSRGRRVSNRDISDLKHAEELANKLANFDTLTGLPNRRLLQDRLDQSLSQAKRNKNCLAVMFIDLDGFKQINDTLGHDVGDQLLIEVGKRLSGCVRQCDTVSRSGGDEFIIVLPVISHRSDASKVAETILVNLRQPMYLGSYSLSITASVGIVVRATESHESAIDLMKKSDIAMYEAKRGGGDAYRFFDEVPS